jgi:ferritin-like metal-binding protein YciE
MNAKIKTLQEALAYQLQGLSYAETKVRDEFERCSSRIASADVKREIKKYIGHADNKVLKLERIFNYLMQECEPRKNEVINTLIQETHAMMDAVSASHLKDVVVVACLQNINAYKIANYKTAYLFAVELELDTAADLLQQIMEWELETAKSLNSLSIHEFNKMTDTATL